MQTHRRKSTACAALLLALLLPAAPARAQAPAGVGPEEQRIMPGDVIRLTVWREEDYSGEFMVHVDGRVVLPRLGDYQVAALTPEALRRELTSDFAAFLREPTIDVVVLRRVRVLGAVHRPDLYNVDPTLTVSDVLARAGGPTPDGADRIELIREGERVEAELDHGMRIADAPIRSGDTIFIPQKPWYLRNLGAVVGAASLGVSILVSIMNLNSNGNP